MQEGNMNINLEFIFPQVNEEVVVEEEVTMEVEEKEVEKESKPENVRTAVVDNESSLDYSQSYFTNAKEIENYFKALPFDETLTPGTL